MNSFDVLLLTSNFILFHFISFFCLFFDRVSLCIPGYLEGTHSVDQDGLELTQRSTYLCLHMLRLKVCATITGSFPDNSKVCLYDCNPFQSSFVAWQWNILENIIHILEDNALVVFSFFPHKSLFLLIFCLVIQYIIVSRL